MTVDYTKDSDSISRDIRLITVSRALSGGFQGIASSRSSDIDERTTGQVRTNNLGIDCPFSLLHVPLIGWHKSRVAVVVFACLLVLPEFLFCVCTQF